MLFSKLLKLFAVYTVISIECSAECEEFFNFDNVQITYIDNADFDVNLEILTKEIPIREDSDIMLKCPNNNYPCMSAVCGGEYLIMDRVYIDRLFDASEITDIKFSWNYIQSSFESHDGVEYTSFQVSCNFGEDFMELRKYAGEEENGEYSDEEFVNNPDCNNNKEIIFRIEIGCTGNLDGAVIDSICIDGNTANPTNVPTPSPTPGCERFENLDNIEITDVSNHGGDEIVNVALLNEMRALNPNNEDPVIIQCPNGDYPCLSAICSGDFLQHEIANIDRIFDGSGLTEIKFVLDYYQYEFDIHDGEEYGLFQVSCDGGNTFNDLRRFGNIDDGEYNNLELIVDSSFGCNNNPNIKLRYQIYCTGGVDAGILDNICIIGSTYQPM